MAGLFFLTMWSLSSFAVSSSRRLAQSYSQGCYDTSEWEQKMKSFLRPRLGSHAMLFLPHSIGQRNPIASQIKESENKPLLGGSCTKLHCKDMCLQRCNKMFNHLCKQETRISRYLFWQFFPQIFIYLLLERGEGREREKERNSNVQEIHRLVAPRIPPAGDLAQNPGMCPDWESNWRLGPQLRHVPWPGMEPATIWFPGWYLSHTNQSNFDIPFQLG